VTGSFREAMMGGAAFILLKAGRGGPETAKQVEIRLAILLKILPIAGLPAPEPGRRGRQRKDWLDLMSISAGYG
jgi:hypothetical protein